MSIHNILTLYQAMIFYLHTLYMYYHVCDSTVSIVYDYL